MKPLFAVIALVASAAISAPALANQELAQKKGCLMCHAIDKKVIGPAYIHVAEKYTAADVERLTHKVLNGGGGVWGTARMVPNKDRGVTEAEAKQLVEWVLSLKKAP
ncbi:cytochrome c551/c552 [Leptothrix ochracea L12]|uniref:Cytochrome c551/c552 n=1 Tax=Leptothrix ochracea L12 TaxID=735332 RepID=I4Z6F8_9BURK|nr:c-type cytochrome [Leptothrix ochracea]EIM31800.1 cytochrome c551/c552 [Leptothrix ochracea L12]